ncbi:hypothetical protein CO614_10605 [Lysobacteraceae bacterium NML120232]|nr:hypothetical protein CO614_10605 [Xanthomonadaceae bacterium NML120232]
MPALFKNKTKPLAHPGKQDNFLNHMPKNKQGCLKVSGSLSHPPAASPHTGTGGGLSLANWPIQ